MPRSRKMTLDDWHNWATNARNQIAVCAAPGYYKVLEVDGYGTFYVRDPKNETVYQGREIYAAIDAYNDI
ncbi:MAG: hypothetical protein E6R03_06260 [Hyphomicrobiaceae bacterium]|nr:MAG: hypothetical protein E6R03_06260 [Hyphomicrobiaceae bacterium]